MPMSSDDDPTGPAGASPDRPRLRVQVFDARVDGGGEWRLEEPPAGGGLGAAIKKALLVGLSVALAVGLWLFAFALMVVLLPLALLGGWWMWRRLKALQRARPPGAWPS